MESNINAVKPGVLVTYAVDEVSGLNDHLVTHAVEKKVFFKIRKGAGEHPKRLAQFTRMSAVDRGGKFRLEVSDDEDIKFIEYCSEEDMQKFSKSLDCYETYQEVIKASTVKNVVNNKVLFEIFGEEIDGRLKSIRWDKQLTWEPFLISPSGFRRFPNAMIQAVIRVKIVF